MGVFKRTRGHTKAWFNCKLSEIEFKKGLLGILMQGSFYYLLQKLESFVVTWWVSSLWYAHVVGSINSLAINLSTSSGIREV